MKFYMFGMWEPNKQNEEEPFDTFIGITAHNGEQAYAKLELLVGEKSKEFILYDAYEV